MQLGTPAVGLQTWELHRDGRADASITLVATSDEAVTTALRGADTTAGGEGSGS